MATGAAPARSTGTIDPGALDPLAVVVTGLGTTNPLGGDLAATWRALRAGPGGPLRRAPKRTRRARGGGG